ncbi:MAG: hypothetical protein JWR15_4209, partial [Prosthecobacter sp.]|nr:hypothetical protein [Prosthecobacter sp.]
VGAPFLHRPPDEVQPFLPLGCGIYLKYYAWCKGDCWRVTKDGGFVGIDPACVRRYIVRGENFTEILMDRGVVINDQQSAVFDAMGGLHTFKMEVRPVVRE